MKRLIFLITVAAVLIMTACDKDEFSSGKITMATGQISGQVKIDIAGTGTIIMDWGDGNELQTHTLWDYETQWQASHSFTHFYINRNAYTIKITGENITHLRCNGIGLKRLDVSKNAKLIELLCFDNQLQTLNVSSNPALKVLRCYDNQIKELDISRNKTLTILICGPNRLSNLDVSQNKELETLYCGTNQLTCLDVSNNSKLKTLICDDNQLTALNVKGLASLAHLNCGKYTYTPEGLGNHLTRLDVSGCTSLSIFNCENNLLSGKALNDLFETLHTNGISATKEILISHNPGATECNKSIAESRGWQVAIRTQYSQ